MPSLVVATQRSHRRSRAKPLIESPPRDPIRALCQRGPVVYFVRTQSMIKIGHTDNIAKRLTYLRDFPDFTWTNLLAVVAGDRAYERSLHKRFRVHRVKGHEYYAPVPELIELINELRIAAGVPAI